MQQIQSKWVTNGYTCAYTYTNTYTHAHTHTHIPPARTHKKNIAVDVFVSVTPWVSGTADLFLIRATLWVCAVIVQS